MHGNLIQKHPSKYAGSRIFLPNWKLWKFNSGRKTLIWKFYRPRFIRCCGTFLHFLTKTHKNRVNRIREAHSLRSVSIADGLSVPAGHLTHSALPHSGALTPLRRFAAPFRPLRTPCSGVLSSCAGGFPACGRRMAQCTVCRKSQAQKACYFHFPLFFHNPCIIKIHFCALWIYFFLAQA